MAIILSTIMAYAGLALVNVGVLCVEFAWWALPAVVGGALLVMAGAILHQRCIGGRAAERRDERTAEAEEAWWEDAA